MIEGLYPVLPFIVGAILCSIVGGMPRKLIALATPVVGLLGLLGLPDGASFTISFFGFELILAQVDRLSFLFALLFHIAGLIGVIYALHVKNRLEIGSALLYVGSAIGTVLAGDLVTLFVGWELLALTSAFIVWSRNDDRSRATGSRYLIFQVLSGLSLLVGILIHHQAGGSLTIAELGVLDLSSPGVPWILLAFGIKAGFPLLHSWIIDTYPAASATGTVFLSAFTTKTAVYALARFFPGTEELILIGAAMTIFPIFYAVIENDLRKVLSYSMINQIGFMVVGIGIGTELAINGAISHAFNDVLFKGLLFMSMGAVLHVTGTTRGTDLGGLWKKMPITTVLCLVGAASISAVPLFSGFVSKSMVMAAALQEGHSWLWFLLLFASAGVLEHAGIKIPYFAFFAHDSKLEAKEPPVNMLLAMTIGAGLCIFIGCRPDLLYNLLPYPVDYLPYTTTHVLTQLQLLLFASLSVVVLMKSGIYPPELVRENLDFDVVYRKGGRLLGWIVENPIARGMTALSQTVLDQVPAKIRQLVQKIPSSTTVQWQMVLPGLMLLLALLVFLLANLFSG
ncbi:MAG TPA: Na(+)/H(+) antiporter subunit D [Planctomycetes bacterium]|nr:Na(+)/H(+) antiporter subunit D [Planctomycetota bacterium]